MANQMRGLDLTDGSVIPMYRIDYTLAELNAAINITATNSSIYHWQSSVGSMLAEPMRTLFRDILWDNMNGGNTLGYFTSAPAGVGRFIDTFGGVETPVGPTVTHSPGAADWYDTVEYDRHRSTASITPAGSWNATDLIGIRPAFSETWWSSGSGQVLPWVIIETSDGYGRRLGFQISFNAFGWQQLAVTRPSGLPSGMPDKINNLKSHFIKDIGKPEVPTLVRYNPRIMTSNVGVYVLNKAQLREFFTDLWTQDVWEGFTNSLIGDGMNALLGVRWFYGIRSSVTTLPITSEITMGKTKFAPANAPVASAEFIEYDFGSIAVPSYFGDYRDWTAVTYKMSIPFVGIIDLNPADILGKTLYLKFIINITDGSAVCILSNGPTSSPTSPAVIFSTSTSWGYDIPVRVDALKDVVSMSVDIMTKVIPAAFGGASAAMAAAKVAGGLSMAGATAKEVANAAPAGGAAGAMSALGADSGTGVSYSAGSLAPNSNVMGDFSARLIMYRHDDLTENLDVAAGKPSTKSGTVGSFTGYVQASVVYNGGSLPMRQAGKIIALLQEGIYV